MRADVFQAVALCCHGNAFLAGRVNKPLELAVHNDCFQQVEEVQFERRGAGVLKGILADATLPWFRRMEKEGVERLKLSLAGCPFDPFEAPAAEWGVVTDGEVGLEIWQPSSHRRFSSIRNDRQWYVTYTSARILRSLLPSETDVETAHDRLRSMVSEVADRVPIIPALANTETPRLTGIAPVCWSETLRKQVQFAADVLFEVRRPEWLAHEETVPQLKEISKALWRAGLQALEAAANATDSAAAEPAMDQDQIRLTGS